MQVPAGQYQLSALPVDSERSSSLMFSPGSIGVNVNSPLLDLEFSQVHKRITLRFYPCSSVLFVRKIIFASTKFYRCLLDGYNI